MGTVAKREKQLDDRHGASAKAASTTANAPNHRDCPDIRYTLASSYKPSALCCLPSIVMHMFRVGITYGDTHNGIHHFTRDATRQAPACHFSLRLFAGRRA
jgi:hypothetical protein